jgi:hypothetical protein
VSGSAATARQILIYSICLVPVSTLPTILGFAGAIYGATAVVCGACLLMLALQLGNRCDVDRRAARRLFAFSIFHLFLLFAALLIGSSSRGSVCSGLAPAQPAPGSHREPAKSRIQRKRALWFCNISAAFPPKRDLVTMLQKRAPLAVRQHNWLRSSRRELQHAARFRWAGS